MMGPWKATRCNAEVVQTQPPHDYNPKTGKEPGVPGILIEWDSRQTTSLWPLGTNHSLPHGVIVDKQMALDLSARLKELAESMD